MSAAGWRLWWTSDVTAAPTLEMLWEANDPGEVLRTRFGFSDGAAGCSWVTSALAQQWGVVVDSCERIVMSDHNALAWVTTPSGRMVLKWSVASTRFPRLQALALLTDWLADKGLPVSRPIAALDGRLQVDVNGASLSLQHEINGELLDTTDPAQVREAGVTLSRLHDALASYHGPLRIPGLTVPPAPLDRQVSDWLDSCPDHIPATALDVLRRLLATASADTVPLQLVHGDYRSANVFVGGSNIVAVIDFEEARIDHRVVELARSAVLLGTRFRNWGPVASEVHAALLDGYETHRQLTPVEVSWWKPLVLWHSLMMMPSGDDPAGWTASALSQTAERQHLQMTT